MPFMFRTDKDNSPTIHGPGVCCCGDTSFLELFMFTPLLEISEGLFSWGLTPGLPATFRVRGSFDLC